MVEQNVCVLMKAFKIILTAMTLLAILFKLNNTASAFHSGGVGPCDACHAMHNASGPADTLLRASDPSSVCLHCHERAGDIGPTKYHVSTSPSDMPQGSPPRQLTPGGDFGWLRKTYTWNPDATQAPMISYGDRHGHNIVANDYFYLPDMVNAVAPQGTYPAASLACISCHDPHGKYRRNADGSITTSGASVGGSGSYSTSNDPQVNSAVGVYRMLGGRNYQPKSVGGNFAFLNDSPAAVAPPEYNRSEAISQTRVAYGSGMSEWCQNCHTTMHTIAGSGSTLKMHPVGGVAKLGSTYSGNYNTYIKTGDLSGTASTSFLSLVPFEEGTGNYTVLKMRAKSDDTYLMGPDPTNTQVMCLTCHRAHASGWDGATRWNTRTDYIVFNGSYSQEGQIYQPYGQGRTEIEAQRAYYELAANRFAANQETLCHKCHTGAIP